MPNKRPPKSWFDRMFKRVADEYPRQSRESREHWVKDIQRIVAGIWHKYPEVTKQRLLQAANPTTGGNLTCPLCGEPNPVTRANVYLHCKKCGSPLVSVRIKKVIRR